MILRIKRRKFKYYCLSLFFLLFILFCPLLIKNYSTQKINPHLMYVHYINVDQGDSMLIQVNNKNILIDSGPKSGKKHLINFLNTHKISTLDYVIATHPHDDHIGNMASVINTYKVKSFYAPKVYSSTKSFEMMVDALMTHNLKIIPIARGCSTIDLGSDTCVEVFSPINESYDNENNYSPVMKITFGNTSFLFTGDAETEVENALLSLNDNLQCNVLKIGHHGSSSSTSELFLKEVNPEYAVISVGRNNMYGHPNKDILSRLKQSGINIFRTDLKNNITFISDKNKISIKYS